MPRSSRLSKKRKFSIDYAEKDSFPAENLLDDSMNVDPDTGPNSRTRCTKIPGAKLTNTRTTRTKIVKTKRVRGNRGKLAMLAKMPLDILFEIFGHLNPMDVLSLARTSKNLRIVLMDRSATSVWRMARSHVKGLPDCPDDLSEPQYANLVFDPTCHECLKSQSQTIRWATRTRWCKKCILETSFIAGSRTFDIPYMDIVPTVVVAGCRPKDATRYCLRTALQYQKEFDQLEEGEKEDWYASKETKLAYLMDHAAQCEVWVDANHQDRLIQRQNVRMTRYEEYRRGSDEATFRIKERLIALGWGDTIAQMEDEENDVQDISPRRLVHHDLVCKPQSLTNRIWDNIREPLIQYLESWKAAFMRHQRHTLFKKRGRVLSQVLEDFAASQPKHTPLPPLGFVAVATNFRAIIEDTPNDIEITAHDFDDAMLDFPDFVEAWLESTNALLVTIMEKSSQVPKPATINILGLATTIFFCEDCDEELGYPQVLMHECYKSYYTVVPTYPPDPSLFMDDFWPIPWNFKPETMIFHDDAYLTAKQILAVSGLNPDSQATIPLLGSDFRFECLHCSNKKGRMVMGWQCAILHSLTPCRKRPAGALPAVSLMRQLTVQKKVRLAELEESFMESSIYSIGSDDTLWDCVWCHATVPYKELVTHKRRRHDVPQDFDEEEYLESEFCHTDFAFSIQNSWDLYQPILLR